VEKSGGNQNTNTPTPPNWPSKEQKVKNRGLKGGDTDKIQTHNTKQRKGHLGGGGREGEGLRGVTVPGAPSKKGASRKKSPGLRKRDWVEKEHRGGNAPKA